MNLRTTLRAVLVVFALVALTIAVGYRPASAGLQTNPEGRVYVMVQWAPGKSAEAKAHLLSNGAEIRHEFDDLSTFAVSMPAGRVNALSNNPNITFWEEDAPRQAFTATVSIPSLISAAQTDSVIPGQQVMPYGISKVQANQVWDGNNDGHVDAGALNGAGRTVCIIDTGYYQGHEDLRDSGVAGYSQQATTWSIDGDGHGSHVAGTIAGEDNNIGVIGVAPGVNLYIVKFFNDDGVATLASDLVAAADKCAAGGANVISMSLGGGRSSQTENTKFTNLYNAGILPIAAAGNDGTTTTSYPAGYASVMSVGGTDVNNARYTGSQQNADVEIAAPGVDVLSTLPYIDTSTLAAGGNTYVGQPVEFAALGTVSGTLVDGGLCDATNAGWSGKVVLCSRGVISFFDKTMNVQNSGGRAAVIYNNVANETLYATLGEGSSSTIPAIGLTMEQGQAALAFVNTSGTVTNTHTEPISGYGNYTGTSMATPHVSAVAALVWSKNPAWTAAQVRQALTATALDLGAAGRDTNFGYGLVQAKAALDYAVLNFGTGGGGGGGTTNALHVSALTATAAKAGGNAWKSTVTVTVKDQNGNLVSGVTVSVSASGAVNGTGSCTTGTNGACSVATGRLTGTSVTWTVTNLAKTGYTYDSAANAATTVVSNKP
jgi:serine protease